MALNLQSTIATLKTKLARQEQTVQNTKELIAALEKMTK